MKKLGRPNGSKNKTKVDKSKIKTESKPDSKPEYSFDTEAINLMATVGYYIRKDIEEWVIEHSIDKQCIPSSMIVKAIKDLGLHKWLKEIEDNKDVKN